MRLSVDADVAKLGIKATYVEAQNIVNKNTDPEFDELKRKICHHIKEEYTDEFIRDDAVLAGFKEVRKRVGRSMRRYPVSIDSLIRFLRRKGTIPSINLAVDIYNVVSLETRLTLGAHDAAQIRGDVVLRLTHGNEHFVPLGSQEEEKIPAGEYCYIDDNNEVLCRLDYKQADKTKITPQTRNCFYIIQGNVNTTHEYLRDAASRLVELIEKYCAGKETIVSKPDWFHVPSDEEPRCE